MPEGRYLFSVDGGGTKTEYCVYDMDLRKMQSFRFGSTNYKNIGLKEAASRLKNAFYTICDSLNIELQEIQGMVIGVSGCDTESDYAVYQSIVKHMGLDLKKVYICNDSEFVFLSVADKPGICVISGTGSIAVGFDKEGKTYRCGGWGRPLSDLGSGYWIGEQMLKKWIKYCDGQEAYNEIYQTLEEFYHFEKAEELPYYIAAMSQRDITAAAHLVCDGADRGNSLCGQVVAEAAEETADLAVAVYERIHPEKQEKIHVVISGSIFKGDFYRRTFQGIFREKTGHGNIEYIPLNQSPAQAGIRLARDIFHAN
ncbi:MAG: hypothetical protein OSJ53_04720 [Kineothrix sp.]|jgi:N-acetylglucosamine kinase-like BadF-type ATPase|nr:hypothetical protein C807_03145 [Lachnospiraceae bacterium 28-4]MCI8845062.1 hypothetical protein [Lachnospiraceae bacterium]MCX4343181.1 hypothetical protein [Kineothrix sp.]